VGDSLSVADVRRRVLWGTGCIGDATEISGGTPMDEAEYSALLSLDVRGDRPPPARSSLHWPEFPVARRETARDDKSSHAAAIAWHAPTIIGPTIIRKEDGP
jgi:hypothetical protein